MLAGESDNFHKGVAIEVSSYIKQQIEPGQSNLFFPGRIPILYEAITFYVVLHRLLKSLKRISQRKESRVAQDSLCSTESGIFQPLNGVVVALYLTQVTQRNRGTSSVWLYQFGDTIPNPKHQKRQ